MNKENEIDRLIEDIATYQAYRDAAPSGATYAKYNKRLQETIKELEKMNAEMDK